MQPQDPNQPQPIVGQPAPSAVNPPSEPIQPAVAPQAPQGMQPQQFAAPQSPDPAIIQPTQSQVTPPANLPQQPIQPTAPQFSQPQQPAVSPSFMQAPQPQAFGQPAMPQSFNSYGQGRSNKKLITMLLGGVSALIILIVGGIFAMNALGGVSRDDYKEAYKLTTDTYSAYSDLSTGFYSIQSDTGSADSKAADMADAKNKFETKLTALGKAKAIKKDADLKADYKKVTDKKKVFYEAYDTLIEAYLYILPEVTKISGYYPSSSTSTSPISSAKSGLTALNLKTESNKKFVNDLLAQLDDYQKYATKYTASLKDYRSYNPSNYTNYSSSRDKVRALITTWRDNLTKTLDDKDINDELNDLGRAVTKKYNDS